MASRAGSCSTTVRSRRWRGSTRDFDWRQEAWETLTHELRHHLEWRARAPDLEEFDWAAEQNFARQDGEPFDPLFYRSGEKVAEGVYRLDDDFFLEHEAVAPGSALQLEFVIEAIWRFLIYTELALAAVRELGTRPAGLQPNAPEWELSLYLAGPGADLGVDFDVRLERAITRLESLDDAPSVEAERAAVVDALYRTELSELRRLLEGALSDRDRVALLIDNLDRAWDQHEDLSPLSYLLLGLLSSAPSITEDLRRGGGRHQRLPLTAAIFIRTDIYSQLVATALEPDKLPVRRLRWEDPLVLIQVIEERYAASLDREVPEGEFWERFFCEQVRGLDIRDYILSRVLPRPRDIIVYVQAAIEAAIVRQSAIVDVEHIYIADTAYSQFAYDAIKVEDPVLGARLEEAIVEFAGGRAILTEEEVHVILRRVGFAESELSLAINHLRNLSFLGIEVGEGDYDYADDIQLKRRADVLARRFADSRAADQRYEVHSAFRPYLGIADPI